VREAGAGGGGRGGEQRAAGPDASQQRLARYPLPVGGEARQARLGEAKNVSYHGRGSNGGVGRGGERKRRCEDTYFRSYRELAGKRERDRMGQGPSGVCRGGAHGFLEGADGVLGCR